MHEALVAWCLALMVHLQPPAVTPWAVTYGETADAFVSAAEQRPLYQGAHAVEETVAVEVALSWFESNFNPKALGDHGASIGLFQCAPGTATPLVAAVRAARLAKGEIVDPWRKTRDELMDPASAAPIAVGLVQMSFRICRDKPHEERLTWFARGGAGCSSEQGYRLSRNRLAKAKHLFSLYPFPR